MFNFLKKDTVKINLKEYQAFRTFRIEHGKTLEDNQRLKFENNRLKEFDEQIQKKVTEIADRSWGSIMFNYRDSYVTSGSFDKQWKGIAEKIDPFEERFKKLEEQMKATDKVFFLADKIEAFLRKLELEGEKK